MYTRKYVLQETFFESYYNEQLMGVYANHIFTSIMKEVCFVRIEFFNELRILDIFYNFVRLVCRLLHL